VADGLIRREITSRKVSKFEINSQKYWACTTSIIRLSKGKTTNIQRWTRWNKCRLSLVQIYVLDYLPLCVSPFSIWIRHDNQTLFNVKVSRFTENNSASQSNQMTHQKITSLAQFLGRPMGVKTYFNASPVYSTIKFIV